MDVPSQAPIAIRSPVADDARHVWELVRRSDALELNTAYAYLLVCTHFAQTSVVAETEGEIVGFVAAYRPPTHPDAVFVWQVGVDDRARGHRIASRMLKALPARPGCAGVRFLEATVTPGNAPSTALFRSVARDFGVVCEESDGFAAELFPGEGHEPERLFRIGPLPADAAVRS